jgi:hypothetical protein
MSNAFIRVPPDSTGKRILHSDMVIIDIDNLTISLDSIPFSATITGQTSGASAKFVGYDIRLGIISIHLSNDDDTWSVGESLVYDGTPFATIVETVVIHIPQVGIIDADSHNPVKVDDRGAIFTRNSDGSQLFDVFGGSLTSTNQVIDTHTFQYGTEDWKYYDYTTVSGSITPVPVQSLSRLSVTDVSGSHAQRTSNVYYPYTAAEGTYVLYSLGSGDEGKAGVVRRWGLYDDDNGLYFQLSGSVLTANVRSSTSGTPVVRSVSQTDFNGDRLLDDNIDTFVVDFSKSNLYWITYQWLGVGVASFGTISPDGVKTTLHTFKNANLFTVPYMQSGTLPVRWEMFNETATASSSEFKVICVSVMRQSYSKDYVGDSYTVSNFQIPISGSDYSHLISARPKATINGRKNRKSLIPTSMQINVDGDPIELVYSVNATLTGSADFSDNLSPYSAFEVEASGSLGMSDVGTITSRTLYGSGVTDSPYSFGILDSLSLGSNPFYTPIFTLSAKCPKPSGNAMVDVVIRWKEVQ